MFVFGQVFNRESFLFFLDLEVKRARRYQDYLSLLSLSSPVGKNPSVSSKTFASLVKDELRGTDLIGLGGENRLLVLLPHADMAAAHKVKQRLAQILEEYAFDKKGLMMKIDAVSFPTHATNVKDLLWRAGTREFQDRTEE